jgi:hypothetical protein
MATLSDLRTGLFTERRERVRAVCMCSGDCNYGTIAEPGVTRAYFSFDRANRPAQERGSRFCESQRWPTRAEGRQG